MSKYRENGFTLIELVITIVLIAVVLGMVLNFFLFNYKTFDRGEELAQVQFDSRMAGDYITTKVRNVNQISNVSITDGEEISLSVVQSLYPNVDTLSFTIIKEQNRNLVNYKIVGKSVNGATPYSIESSILLNNIRDMEPIDTSFSTLYFKN